MIFYQTPFHKTLERLWMRELLHSSETTTSTIVTLMLQ